MTNAAGHQMIGRFLEVHRFPDDFEIGDSVGPSDLAKDEKICDPKMRGLVVGHNKHGCVLVNTAKNGARRKMIRPFKPEFLEKE